MTTNLVFATYNGNYENSIRHNINIDVNFKLNNIKCVLETIDTKIYDQITIVISEEHDIRNIDNQYDNYLKKLKNTDKIKIVKKKNDKWVSYSSYYEAYKHYPNFDYYIFFEDDYIPLNNYKNVAISHMNENKYDYVFGIINNEHKIVHACHSLLLTKGNILCKIFSKFYEKMVQTKLPHQMAFYKLFTQLDNIKGGDLSNIKFSMPFYITNKKIITYYINNKCEPLVMPIQYYYLRKKKYPNNKCYDYYVLQNNQP